MLIHTGEHELRIILIHAGIEITVACREPKEEVAVISAVRCGDMGRALYYISILREERGREVDTSVGRQILSLCGNIIIAEGLAVLRDSCLAGHLICLKHAVAREIRALIERSHRLIIMGNNRNLDAVAYHVFNECGAV